MRVGSWTMFTWLQSCEIKCWVSRTQRAIDQTLTQLLPSPFTSLDLKFYHFTHYTVASGANNEKHQPCQCFSFISHLFWFFKAATVVVGSLLLFCSKHYINIFTAIKVTMKEVKEPMRPLITGGIDIFPKWSWICELVAVANHWAVLGGKTVVNYQ